MQFDAAAPRVARGGSCNKTVPYCALDLQSAYGLTQAARNGGKGSIVGIVDAYGYPSAASDLAVYRRTMGLPSCGAVVLRSSIKAGAQVSCPNQMRIRRDDWRLEQALDLDMVSAICPNCRIVLVQANSNKNADLAAAVNAAAALGATAIGNSYSGKEENARDTAYQHAGRAITASAGDGGRRATSTVQLCDRRLRRRHLAGRRVVRARVDRTGLARCGQRLQRVRCQTGVAAS